MKKITILMMAVAAVAANGAVACADDPPTVELPFAPGDTLAYSHDGCEAEHARHRRTSQRAIPAQRPASITDKCAPYTKEVSNV